MNNLVEMILNFRKKNDGAALLMVVIILASILTVSLASANILGAGIKMNRAQSQSTKAFFAAESGAEQALWEVRRNNFSLPSGDTENVFNFTLSNGSSYQVDYSSSTPDIILKSTGNFLDVKRSIAVNFPQDSIDRCVTNCLGKSCGDDDGCGGACPSTCTSHPGCGSAIANASITAGSCCEGQCYACDEGYAWNGSICEPQIPSAATIDGWCWDCSEYTYPDPQDPLHGDIKEYIDFKF